MIGGKLGRRGQKETITASLVVVQAPTGKLGKEGGRSEVTWGTISRYWRDLSGSFSKL